MFVSRLKCDRQLPCGNCTKRGVSSSCTFVHGNPGTKSTSVHKSSSTRDVQSQIQHLEELVISMMNKANKDPALKRTKKSPGQLTPTSQQSSSYDRLSSSRTPERSLSAHEQLESDFHTSAETFGRISMEDHTSYVGQSHWTAILDNVRFNLVNERR